MLDFEYAKALAEVVLDTTCSEKERFATGIDKAGYAGFFESQYTPLFWREIYS